MRTKSLKHSSSNQIQEHLFIKGTLGALVAWHLFAHAVVVLSQLQHEHCCTSAGGVLGVASASATSHRTEAECCSAKKREHSMGCCTGHPSPAVKG